MTNKLFLRELADKLEANSNGSLLFFKNAGLTIQGEYPTLEDTKQLYDTNYKEFKKLIEFLYKDEIAVAKANADGTETETIDNKKEGWNFANNLVNNIGGVFSAWLGRGNSTPQVIQVETEEKSNTTLYIIIGIVIAILVVGIGIYIYKKKK